MIWAENFVMTGVMEHWDDTVMEHFDDKEIGRASCRERV